MRKASQTGVALPPALQCGLYRMREVTPHFWSDNLVFAERRSRIGPAETLPSRPNTATPRHLRRLAGETL